MTGLLRADLRRILRKKGVWILLFVFLLFTVVDFLRATDAATPQDIVQRFQNLLGGRFLLLTVIYTYLVIFGDGMSSNAEVYVLGRGMRKGTFLFIKLLECLILTGFFYGWLGILRNGMFRLSDVPMVSERQMGLLNVYGVFMVIRAIWCLALAVLLQHVFRSTAPAILSLVITGLLSAPMLKLLQTLYRIDIYNFVPDGLLDAALLNYSSGNLPWQLAVVILLYIGGTLLAAVAIFQKKEPEL